MALLNENITEAQKQVLILTNQSNNLFYNLKRTYTDGINLVWDNKKATPTEVLSALGTSAVKVFQNAEALRVFINSVIDLNESDETPIPAPNTDHFTVHEDGTITLNA